jgi:hypothetical protein
MGEGERAEREWKKALREAGPEVRPLVEAALRSRAK